MANHFDVKELRETNYILGIKFLQDHINKILSLSQPAYIDKILVKFVMHNSKKGLLPFKHRVPLSKEHCSKNFEEEEEEEHEGNFLCFDSRKPNVCYTLH